MTNLRWLIIITLVLSSHSPAIEQVITTQYVLGEAESIVDARPLAIEKIKLLALEKTGSYLEGRQSLLNGHLTEEITSLGYSILRVSHLKEVLSVTGNGSIQLELTAMVEIDENSLMNRIQQLDQSDHLKQKLQAVSARNQELRQQLTALLNEHNNSAHRKGYLPLHLAKQKEILGSFQENGQQLSALFDSEQISAHINTSKELYYSALHDLHKNLLLPILGTPITTQLLHLERNSDGSLTAHVNVGWSLDHELVHQQLSKHFTMPPPPKRGKLYTAPQNVTGVHFKDNRTGSGPYQFSHDLLDYLEKNPIHAQVSVGQRKITIPVMYAASAFFNSTLTDQCSQPGSKYRRTGKSICFYSQDLGPGQVLPGTLRNPIKIRLSKDDEENLAITASMVSVHTLAERTAANANQ